MATKTTENTETATLPVAKAPMKLDLNKANIFDLLDVPFISARRAKSLLHYREAHGAFSDMREVADVPGFNQALVRQVSDWFTITD